MTPCAQVGWPSELSQKGQKGIPCGGKGIGITDYHMTLLITCYFWLGTLLCKSSRSQLPETHCNARGARHWASQVTSKPEVWSFDSGLTPGRDGVEMILDSLAEKHNIDQCVPT